VQREQIEEMYAVESTHWWFSGKRLLMRRLLGERLHRPGLRLLDVGCGAGANAAELARYGSVVACDRSLDALGFVRSRGIASVVAASAPELPFAGGSFDVVTAYDVLEHVDDDARFLSELARVLRSGGALALHVPAWPFLWSSHDVALEHKRRYTRAGLRRLLERSGLRLDYLGWASCAIFAPAAAVRLLRRAVGGDEGAGADLGVVPAPINGLLRGIYRLEASIAARTGLPFGVSLAAVLSRP